VLTNRFIGSELKSSISAALEQLPLWKYSIVSIKKNILFFDDRYKEKQKLRRSFFFLIE
jgi:hypothetical protein